MNSFRDLAQEMAPAVQLEQVLSRGRMSYLRMGTGAAAATATSLGLIGTITGHPYIDLPYLWYGTGMLLGGLWFEQLMLYTYHNHYFFAGTESHVKEPELSHPKITYNAARIINRSSDDLTATFLRDTLGAQVATRTGLAQDTLEEFLQGTRHTLTATQIPAPSDDTTVTFSVLGTTILTYDQELSEFLESQGIRPIHFLGALRWVEIMDLQQKFRERWWSKRNLLNSRGIGGSWSYGYTAHLNRILRPVRTSAVFSVFGTAPQYAQEKVEEVSEVLLHEKAGNALLLGEAGVGKADVVMALEHRIYQNQSVAGLQHKRIAILDMDRIFSTTDQSHELEQELHTILKEAADAGNIILVIERISDVLRTASERGVNLKSILDPYLAHPQLQFIVTDTPHGFHTELQPEGTLLRRFGQIVIDIPDTETVVRILQRSCQATETKHRVLFTYPALISIAQGAHRYVTDGVAPDSALSLMVEIAAHKSGETNEIITAADVDTYISTQTGIPMGSITDTERDVLLHLEDRLHERVVGQTPAINAIADTIRRARVGIQDSSRPLGSFLFLGPTGVGKTETAKTLAHVFFGSDEHMTRFDMSEYNHEDALVQLVGNQSEPGVLSAAIHDQPYTVVLLDEFEKAHQTVHDLFLQILDEGVFTSGRGDQINARNTIIIATSNAGSDLIYQTTTQRKADASLNHNIMQHIINQGIFRPELINRFDNTIIFEPLAQEEQTAVAHRMLATLQERIRAKGYHLQIADDVITYLTEQGYSATFGARAMRREIQDNVESAVAEKIIREQPTPGSTLIIHADDLATQPQES
jgi:ATP-dependent Clp protease ATP-binding subunit ClpC